MSVAETAVAALATTTRWPGSGEIGEHAPLSSSKPGFRPALSARRRRRARRRDSCPPVHAGLGLEMLLVAKVDERVEAVRAFDHDVAAPPPSPPSGPPNSMYFSRRNETGPAPPSPERTYTAPGREIHRAQAYHGRAPGPTPRRRAARRSNPRGLDGSWQATIPPRAAGLQAGRQRKSALLDHAFEASFSTRTLATISTVGVSPKACLDHRFAASVARPLPQASGAAQSRAPGGPAPRDRG